MKIFLFLGFILLAVFSACEKAAEDKSILCSARVAGFDLNCSTCIVSFPDDLLRIKKLFGESPDNFYAIINLDKGNFKVGDKLQVNVRKAENDELKACISMYPSSGYINLYVSNYEEYNNIRLNDTVILPYKNCHYDPVGQTYICFDSVTADSRCPDGVYCIWAGEARVRFKIENYNHSAVFIELKEGVKDTVTNGYKVSFPKLLPYPLYGKPSKPEDYKAILIIQRF